MNAPVPPSHRPSPSSTSATITAKAEKYKPLWRYRKTDFYRQARHVHAWLSAFAFIVLMFFSATGLLLNHPEWMDAAPRDEVLHVWVLNPVLLQQARTIEQPSTLLLAEIRRQYRLFGQFRSSEKIDQEWLIRLEGPRGQTDIVLDLVTGRTEIRLSAAQPLSLLADLHKGKNVGVLWSWLIDVSAIVVLLLSLAGYVLFFSLKKRLSTSLWLTGGSVFVLVALFMLAVY